jgi:hypothetical protein
MWRDKFFQPMQARLTSAMIALITADRNGEPVTTSILTDTTQCYGIRLLFYFSFDCSNLLRKRVHSYFEVRLGTQKENPKISVLEIYNNYFEKPFIAAVCCNHDRRRRMSFRHLLSFVLSD